MAGSSLSGSLRETLAVFDDSEPGAPLTTTEVADRLDLGRRSTYERLDRLVDRGRLNTKKVGARGRVWWRSGSSPESDPDERDLERRREQLAALNDLYGVVHDIVEEVIEQSTREQIEEIVCNRLAESSSYLFAWIGEVDAQTQTVTLRTEAGVEGYLDGITISVDPDDERSKGPTGQAVLGRETRVTQDIHAANSYDPWREKVREYGFRSSAAIPIVHEDTVYGVLNVYAERPYAFTDDERAVIGQLGEVIGYAVAAVERKRALISDEVVELEFRMGSVFETVENLDGADGTVALERIIPIGEDTYLGYGTTTGNAAEAIETMVEGETVQQWKAVTVHESTGEGARFELKMGEPSPPTIVAAHGGNIQEARIEESAFYMRAHFALSADVSRIVDAVTAVYPGIDLVTQRQVADDRRSTARLRHVLFETLTDRQQAVLEVAYRSGYFAYPREKTGEEIADSLEVSASTVHQHLRTAEGKLLAALFAE